MKTPDLIVRCYLKPSHSHYVAVCIDLCLAAQADTAHDARVKLERQIADYLEEALTIDRAFAAKLLTRKAPMSQRLEYWRILLTHTLKASMGHVFNTVMPVYVGKHSHA